MTVQEARKREPVVVFEPHQSDSSTPACIPDELRDTLDEETHRRSQEYATRRAKLGTIESTAGLTLLLGFCDTSLKIS